MRAVAKQNKIWYSFIGCINSRDTPHGYHM